MSWEPELLEAVKALAIAGADDEEIAVMHHLPRSQVREICRLLGVPIDPLAKREWCDRCCSWRTSLDPDTGWCDPCTQHYNNELQREADAAEEDRLRKEAMKQNVTLRKRRERMREEFDANPRKRKAAE